MARIIIGIVLVLAGIVFGLYTGLWLCFIGGIVGIVKVVVDLLHGSSFEAALLAISILKIFLSGVVGYISAMVLVLPGAALLSD